MKNVLFASAGNCRC